MQTMSIQQKSIINQQNQPLCTQCKGKKGKCKKSHKVALKNNQSVCKQCITIIIDQLQKDQQKKRIRNLLYRCNRKQCGKIIPLEINLHRIQSRTNDQVYCKSCKKEQQKKIFPTPNQEFLIRQAVTNQNDQIIVQLQRQIQLQKTKNRNLQQKLQQVALNPNNFIQRLISLEEATKLLRKQNERYKKKIKQHQMKINKFEQYFKCERKVSSQKRVKFLDKYSGEQSQQTFEGNTNSIDDQIKNRLGDLEDSRINNKASKRGIHKSQGFKQRLKQQEVLSQRFQIQMKINHWI